MSFRKLSILLASVFTLTVMLVSGASAQLAIEKSFVAKSRLHNAIWKKHDASSAIVVDHSGWNAFLSKYVARDGRGVNRVAYRSVGGADKKALKSYLASLQATDVTKLNRNEQYAFWLNLYNASIVNVALDNLPIDSILKVKSSALDLKGPFNDVVAKVNGKRLTPDQIESGIVRPIWKDPRLHYAFNCAAISCPNLGRSAYTGSAINAQLDAAAVSYVNDPRGIRVNGGKVTASKIYFWYNGDFGGSEKAVIKHISRYAKPGLKAALKGVSSIDAYEYDWALNAR